MSGPPDRALTVRSVGGLSGTAQKQGLRWFDVLASERAHVSRTEAMP
jgi:hypothetical protein